VSAFPSSDKRTATTENSAIANLKQNVASIEDSTTEGCPVSLSILKLNQLMQFQRFKAELAVRPRLLVHIDDDHFDELKTSKPESGEWKRFPVEKLHESFDRETEFDKHKVNNWIGQVVPRSRLLRLSLFRFLSWLF
jgi:hypothetical protein